MSKTWKDEDDMVRARVGESDELITYSMRMNAADFLDLRLLVSSGNIYHIRMPIDFAARLGMDLMEKALKLKDKPTPKIKPSTGEIMDVTFTRDGSGKVHELLEVSPGPRSRYNTEEKRK